MSAKRKSVRTALGHAICGTWLGWWAEWHGWRIKVHRAKLARLVARGVKLQERMSK